ncbi:hypothetical protein TNCV_2679871 [Trichonephila clavipes]|nr:hypothetical protein TNCV_2679871 [Trichonephila clavipes]
MDKCVQMLDKELWRLGPDGSGEKEDKKVEGERTEGEDERRRKRRERERSPPCMEKRAESGIGVEKRGTPVALRMGI